MCFLQNFKLYYKGLKTTTKTTTISIIVGISFITLGLSVGTTVTLMMYFKVIHPPAAANPLIALFADVSIEYILFPVIMGSIIIIIISLIINKIILKRNYPTRWF